MRIPTSGMSCMFVLRAASPADNRPAEMRPAKIVRVNSYDQNGMDCNLLVSLDGRNDDPMVNDLGLQGSVDGFTLWATDCKFDKDGSTNSFQWMNYQYGKIESFKVRDDITHGRETILAGAEGIWDQNKNTITFPREKVTDLHADLTPTYPGDKFIDQHCARLDAPEGYVWVQGAREDDGKESPDERQRMLDSVRERDQFNFQRIHQGMFNRFLRQMGLPAFPQSIMPPHLFDDIWQRSRQEPSRQIEDKIEKSPFEMTDQTGEKQDRRQPGHGARRELQKTGE